MKSKNTEIKEDRRSNFPWNNGQRSSKESGKEGNKKSVFPYFHLLLLCTILGTAAMFWLGGRFVSPITKKDLTVMPSIPPISPPADQFEKGASIHEKSENLEDEQVAKSNDSNLTEAIPTSIDPVLEDPATKMFGVVSRIRESRLNQ